MLLEAFADALLGGHPLGHAAVDAATLAGRDGLGGEVVDAGHEAVLNESAEGLNGASVLAGPNYQREPGESSAAIREDEMMGAEDRRTPMNSLTWRFCMRCSSMRCSLAVNLGD